MGIGIVHHSGHHSSPANIAHDYFSMRYTSFDGKNGAGGELVSPCKHHTYTVFEAILRISSVTEHVKCITLVYPVVYPHRNLRVME